MEYVQMTLDDWVQMKQKLRQELIGVKQSFVRIGYALRQIDDQRLYENDGYKSIAEFAKAEYGLEASTTSRFMSINREYSIDGYSEHLRPEYTDLGRSQLIEKFFEENKDILNEVYSNEFDEESMSRFAEIVNPAGNRSFKKGLYFMMMYENRVTIKKFGDTPKNMSWWEFYQRMSSIFDEDAAGTRTWQNHFGGDDETQENEPTGEHTTAETPESEDDNAAVGEAGTDEVEETESGSVADNEPAPGAGEEQKDDSTDRDTDCGEDNKEPADRPEEQTGEKSLAEQIAPAQKSTETLEKEEVEDDETGENESSDAENQTAESEPETAEREQTEETEVIEAVYGTRKEYMDRLSEQGMAEYMADEYKSHRLLVTDLANIWNLRKWLSEKVDRFGKPMEDAR